MIRVYARIPATSIIGTYSVRTHGPVIRVTGAASIRCQLRDVVRLAVQSARRYGLVRRALHPHANELMRCKVREIITESDTSQAVFTLRAVIRQQYPCCYRLPPECVNLPRDDRERFFLRLVGVDNICGVVVPEFIDLGSLPRDTGSTTIIHRRSALASPQIFQCVVRAVVCSIRNCPSSGTSSTAMNVPLRGNRCAVCSAPTCVLLTETPSKSRTVSGGTSGCNRRPSALSERKSRSVGGSSATTR